MIPLPNKHGFKECDKLGGLKKALRPFSAELPKSDSDTCLEGNDSDFAGPSPCKSDFRAVILSLRCNSATSD